MNENKKDMIRPFEIATEKEQFIKPFTIGKEYQGKGNDISKDTEKTNQEDVQENNQFMTAPFIRVSAETADIAANYAKMFSDCYGDTKSLEPYLALAIDGYQKANGVIAPAIMKMGMQMGVHLNFALQLLRRIINVQDTSEGEKFSVSYRVEVTVYLKRGTVRKFEATIPSEKIKNPEWLKKATRSLATIPNDKDKKEEFWDIVQDCIETENVPREIIYPAAGWRCVPDIGWRYIFHDGIISEQTPFVHTSGTKYTLELRGGWIGIADTFYKAVDMMNICNDGRASTSLFLITHAAVLTKLFKLANYPISFIYILEAPTNSRKTSLSLAVSQVFDRDKLIADAEFATATNCGIEKTLSLYPDAPVHIDDFKPGVSRSDQKTLEKKLDEVARFGGNGVPKMRMTDFMADGDSKYFPIGGVTIITAELVSAVSSSESRMFITEFGKDTVMNDRLKYYQDHRWILPSHLYDFLAWVTADFEAVVDFIRTRFPDLRDEFSFEFGRYSEMYATFLVTAEILAQYACAKGFWSKEVGGDFVRSVKSIILADLRAMEEKVRLRDKGKLILDALLYAIDHHIIKSVELTKDTCSQRLAVYENDDFYFIQIRELRRLVSEYVSVYRENREVVNDDELCSELEKKDAIEISIKKDGSRERARKLPVQRGNTLRYLYIKKAVLKEANEDV